MNKKLKSPSLSLIVNPAAKPATRQHAPDSDRSLHIEQPCCRHAEVAYPRDPGRGFNDRNNVDAETRETEARVDTFFDSTPAQPRALHASMILDQSFDEIYIFAAASLRLIYVNDTARRNLQYSLDEIKRRAIVDISPDYSLRTYGRLLAPLQSGEKTLIELETVLKRKDGFRYPVKMRVSFCQVKGTPAFVCIASDTTERRRAADVLLDKELAEATLESIAEAVITIDAGGRIVYFNRMAERLTGCSAMQAKGMRLESVLFLINGETRKPAELPFVKMLIKGDAVGFTAHTRLRSRDGREYAVDGSVAPAHTRGAADAVVVLTFHEDSTLGKGQMFHAPQPANNKSKQSAAGGAGQAS